MMDAFWAVPEWAPADESHLLGSSSVVTKISYGKGSVTYSTFEPSLGRPSPGFRARIHYGRREAPQPTRRTRSARVHVHDSTHVLRIRHDDARDIDVQGKGGNVPPQYVSFDDPHLLAVRYCRASILWV